jgi:hypothetical protein
VTTRTPERSRVFELAVVAGLGNPRVFPVEIPVATADAMLAAVVADDAAALDRAIAGVVVSMKYRRRPISTADVGNLRVIVRDARHALRRLEAEATAVTAQRDRLRELLGLGASS